ncbi:MAG: hypothetical protein F6K00_33780 [Leptolyngbya sp. SIOISBB]|nr:hypothetical protein [Leptolyngbya sp. SIOISBB]
MKRLWIKYSKTSSSFVMAIAFSLERYRDEAMQHLAVMFHEVVEDMQSNELAEALELAQELGGLITRSEPTGFQVCFDNEALAKQFTRRVNQATETLTALRENLCVTVTAG